MRVGKTFGPFLLGAVVGCGSADETSRGEAPLQSEPRGMKVGCDEGSTWLEQLTPGGGTWRFYIKRNGAGQAAQDLIFHSAERHAFEASQEGDSRPRDFYWMNPNLPKAESEYLFDVVTPFGWDIKSAADYGEGRRMTDAGSQPSLFWADVLPTEGGATLRFVLRTARGTFRTSGGAEAACRYVSAQSKDCTVQEFIFRNCRME